jgi:hypothetical protein
MPHVTVPAKHKQSTGFGTTKTNIGRIRCWGVVFWISKSFSTNRTTVNIYLQQIIAKSYCSLMVYETV